MLSYLIFRTGAVSGSAPVHSEQWIQMNRYMYTCDHTSTIKHFLYSSKTQFPIIFPIHVYKHCVTGVCHVLCPGVSNLCIVHTSCE